MSIIGIEEIFLKVRDMEKALDFYHGMLGLALDKQVGERTYLQAERGQGRALFMIDPDGNETEVNTRYLYGVPKR